MPVIVDFRVRLPNTEHHADRVEDHPPWMRRYQQLFDFSRLEELTPAGLIAALDAAGIGLGVLQAEYEYGDFRAMNRAVAEIVDRFRNRLVGFGTVNPADTDNLAREVEIIAGDLGLKGVNLQPWAYAMHANDKAFYPLYAKCCELGLVVTIHTGINYSADRTIAYGRPLAIDEIACAFPDLVIVANHAGWPWVPEMVAVARKHPQVYLEVGGVAPRYLAAPGAGWEMWLRFGGSVLQNQILFATDSIIPFDRAVSEARALPLKPEVQAKFLGGNALTLLGLEP